MPKSRRLHNLLWFLSFVLACDDIKSEKMEINCCMFPVNTMQPEGKPCLRGGRETVWNWTKASLQLKARWLRSRLPTFHLTVSIQSLKKKLYSMYAAEKEFFCTRFKHNHLTPIDHCLLFSQGIWFHQCAAHAASNCYECMLNNTFKAWLIGCPTESKSAFSNVMPVSVFCTFL